MGIVIRRRGARPRLESLEVRALLSGAGSLDPSFGGGTGSAALPLGLPANNSTTTTSLQVGSLVVAPGGKLVENATALVTTSGSSGLGQTGQLSIGRFNADGSVDTTFGASGQAVVPIPFFSNEFYQAVQPNGKIIEASSAYNSSDQIEGYLALRLNGNGTLDTTFGSGGIALYPASVTTSNLGTVDAVLVQTNGQILLAGTGVSSSVFAAVRLNADGSLDTSYGTGGTTLVPVEANGFTKLGPIDHTTGAALQADGKLVLVGTAVTGQFTTPIGQGPGGLDTDGVVLRLNTDGSVDTSFGGTGSVLIPPVLTSPSILGGVGNLAVAIQPIDQKIVVANGTVERLNTDGSFDSSFGAGGQATPTLTGFNPDILANTVNVDSSVIIDADDRIVASELVTPAGNGTSVLGVAIVRLDADGSADPTFGNTTTASGYQPGLKSITGATLAVDSGGNVLVGGTGSTGSPQGRVLGFSVARLLGAASIDSAASPPPATPPASFTNNASLTLPAVYNTTTATLSYPVVGESTIPFQVQFGSPGAGQSIPAAADYLGSGTTQFAVYLPAIGAYATLASNGQVSKIFQFGIPGAGQSIPVPADYEGTGQDDYAIYMPSIATYAILPSSGAPGYEVAIGQPGLGNSIPAPADYFGTGRADLAVYLPKLGVFAIPDPTGQTSGEIVPFGAPGQGDIPVPGDYDGSGHVELAIYIPSYGEFVYRPYGGGPDVAVPIGKGGVGEIPVPGDYDGSGHLEFAIYDPTVGVFAYKPADGGPIVSQLFGPTGGVGLPVAASAASLPEFAGSSASSGPGAKGNAIALGSGSSGQVSAASVTVTRSSTLPSGPTLGSARVARTLINQGSTDTFKLSS